MHELGSWQASGGHQLTDFTSSLTSRFSRCRAGVARITRARAAIQGPRRSQAVAMRKPPLSIFPGVVNEVPPVVRGLPWADLLTPPYSKIWSPERRGSLRRSGKPAAEGFTPHTRRHPIPSHRRRLAGRVAREGIGSLSACPPAGVLGCPYPYRLVFACSTCSGVPPFRKSLIYKGFTAGASWNTDSVPACSKVFQVFRFRGAQRIGEQAENPRQSWATACLAVRVLAGGRHDAQHWRQVSSSGASCSACWPGAGVQAGQSACGRGTSSRNAHGSARPLGKGRRWPAGAVARGWRSRCWPASSIRAPAGPPAGQASGSPVQQRGEGAGRPGWQRVQLAKGIRLA